MKLALAEQKQQYIIQKINTENEDILSRFYKLGLFPGAEICLKRKAPLFKDPLLFEVAGSQVALTKDEANLLEVKMSSLCQ